MFQSMTTNRSNIYHLVLCIFHSSQIRCKMCSIFLLKYEIFEHKASTYLQIILFITRIISINWKSKDQRGPQWTILQIQPNKGKTTKKSGRSFNMALAYQDCSLIYSNVWFTNLICKLCWTSSYSLLLLQTRLVFLKINHNG